LANGPVRPPTGSDAGPDAAKSQEFGEAPDIGELRLIQGYLAAPRGLATREQELAWREFYDFCERMIPPIIRRHEDHWDKVDDLAQEVWVVALLEIPERSPDRARGTLRAWIAGVARNVSREHARRRSRRREENLMEELAAALVGPDVCSLGGGKPQERRELARSALDEVGEHLSELNRRILVMRAIEGMKIPAVAAAFGISVGAVTMRLHRALRDLRELLRGRRLGPS
jgi:RNA polymerase sigma-70 factor (ECF subfamily)